MSIESRATGIRPDQETAETREQAENKEDSRETTESTEQAIDSKEQSSEQIQNDQNALEQARTSAEQTANSTSDQKEKTPQQLKKEKRERQEKLFMKVATPGGFLLGFAAKGFNWIRKQLGFGKKEEK